MRQGRRFKAKWTHGKLMPWLALTLVFMASMHACGGGAAEERTRQQEADLAPVPLQDGEALRVVATTNIVGDAVSQVGGDRIELVTLMGTGLDPHTYVPSPAHTAAIHDAHVVFLNGAGLEASLEEMLASAGGDAVLVYLSDGLQLREAEGEPDKHGGGADAHGAGDPHVWFDVQNVIHWTGTIEQTLSALDPEDSEVFASNAAAYAQELEDLDGWVAEQLATIPETHRQLVTNHPSFGYLADRYGLEQVGAVYPVSPSSEPSAQDIASLEDTIREYGVPAVFAESTVNPKLVQQVAGDTGIKLVPLYTGSLGEPGSGAESYILLMRYNVNAIVEALR